MHFVLTQRYGNTQNFAFAHRIDTHGHQNRQITYLSIFEAIRKAGSTDTDKLVAAFKGLRVDTPIGPVTFRASDGQSTMGAWVGTTRLDPSRGGGIMVNHEYVPGERVLPPDEVVKKLRIAGPAKKPSG